MRCTLALLSVGSLALANASDESCSAEGTCAGADEATMLQMRTLREHNKIKSAASGDPVYNTHLSAYWESGNCGVHGNDWNWGWCGNQAGDCPQTVATDLCASGEAELVAYNGDGSQNSYSRDGCNYFWHAQYQCTNPHYDSRLSAYWESGNCGIHNNDWNWNWCNRHAGDCPQTVETQLCSSGTAELVAFNGDGSQNSFSRDGCNYFWHAQYACQYDSELSAYWESGNCGAHGNDWNWGWCGNQAGDCPDTVSTDRCASGTATLATYNGNGNANSYIRDGCNYFWHAQYVCAPLNDYNSRLSAYWESGNCGVHGNDWNWEWCGQQAGNCPQTVATDRCDSGFAELVEFNGDGGANSYSLQGCNYFWHAQYDCLADPPNQIQGCPGARQEYDETDTADVRCCSMDGSTGNSGTFPRTFTFSDGSSTTGRDCGAGDCNGDASATCHDDVTFEQAEEICRANGERLCTSAEISVTCGTGCMHNHHRVWYSDTPATIEEQYVGCFVDDSARDFGPMLGSATNAATDSYDECARACDKAFIALQWGGECFCSDTYGNGAQYTQVPDDECDHPREPCASTSFNCGGTWRQAVYQIRPVTGTNSDGCQTSNSNGPDEHPTTAQTDPDALGAIRCCSWDGNSCQTQDLPGSVAAPIPPPGPADVEQACYTAVTYAKALDVCNEAGMRLCSVEELDSGVCCGTGCWNDHRATWVQ